MPLDFRPGTGLISPTTTARSARSLVLRVLVAACAALAFSGIAASAAQAGWNLSISKTTIPAGGTGFGFSVTGPSSFSTSVSGINDGGTASGGALSGLAEGTSDWVVTEVNPGPAYTLTSINCTSSTSNAIDVQTVNLTARSVTLRVDGSGTPNVSCKFTNTKPTGTITVNKGGTRTATDTDGGYANPLGGASFEYAAYVSDPSIATWFPLCTDADSDGSCTGPSLANGRYLVRETLTGAPAGWRTFQQLAWGGGSSGQSPTRPYVGDVTVAGADVTVRPSNVFPSTSGSGSGSFINAKNNPDFPQACGIDMVLVLDRSGSINDQPGEADAYRAAAQSFINSLAGTPTRVKIFSFAASASANQNTFLDLSVAADVTAANNVIAGIYANTGGGTNWDAGLDLASGAGVDTAVVITDGNPTVRDSSDGDAGSSSDVDLLDLTFGIASANKVKTLGKNGTNVGAKVIGVGVGDGVTPANIEAISAPGDAYTSSLTQLQDTLKQIANALCGSRIKVRKLVTGVAGQENVPQAGWEFLATSTNSAVNGALAYQPANRLTAGSPAELLVQVDQIPGAGAPVTIDETPGALYDFASAACATGSYGGPAVPGTSVNAGNQTITLPDVDRNQDIFCTFTNARKTGKLEVRKNLAPTDDPGHFNLQIDGSTAGTGAAVGHGGTTGEVSLPSATYSVGETAAAGSSLTDYTSSVECRKDDGAGSVVASNSDGPSVSVAVSSTSDIVCVITNTRKTGRVKLVKDIVPVDAQLGDPGKFDLHIDGEGAYDTTKTDAVDGDSVQLTVPNGPVDLSETAGTGTSLGDYTSSYSCTSDGDQPVSGSGIAIDDLPVTAGDDWVCTITNTRKKGKVTLVKDIVPVDAQLGDPGKFDLHIDGEGAYDATKTDAVDGDSIQLTVPNGPVDLSETAGTGTSLGDYTSSYSCTSDGDQPVSGSGIAIDDLPVTAGDDWVCTITNTRKKGKVTLVKDIVPVDAQLGDPGKFDLHIDGEGAYDATKTDAVDGDSIQLTVPNGPVDLSETAGTGTSLGDYTSSYSCTSDGDQPVSGSGIAIDDLPVTAGDDWVCTITNTRKKGKVTLVKDIVPVDAQLGDPGKFDLHIDGEGAYDATKTDAVDGDSIQLTVPNGPVDLSETAGTGTSLGDYTSSYSCTSDGDQPVSGSGIAIDDLPVTAGDDWVCTITNTRKKGKVTLVKDIVPVDAQLGDPGKFDLHIDGEGAYDATKADAVDGDSIQLTVPNGPVDLSETAGTGTSLGDYISTYTCVNLAQDSGDEPISGDGTAIEDLPVTAGDDWRCVLRNERKQSSVKLTKVIVAVDAQLGDPGLFDLEIDGAGSNDKTREDAGNGDSTALNVPSGPVNLSEAAGTSTDLSDYVSTYECVNTAQGSQDAPVSGEGTTITGLVVSDGDRWECTFTNTRKKGHVKLIKDIVPVDEQLGDPGKFDLAIDGEGGYDASKDEAGDGDFVERDVPNGPVDLSESADDETTLADYTTSYTCLNEGDDPVTGSGISISDLPVGAGDDWTCTFRNERKRGKVTVVKQLDPASDSGLFNLSIDGPLGYDKTGSDRGHGGSVTIDVPTGTADVAEEAGTGTTLAHYISTYRCENVVQGSEDTPITGSGTSVAGISVTTGDDWVCVFTNVRKPLIVVKKLTEPGDEATAFPFTSNLPATSAGDGTQEIAGDGAFTLKHGQQVQTLAAPGSYSVTESDVYALNYKLKSAVCEEKIPNDDRFDQASNEQSDADRTRSFTADAGDVITCTFVNEKLTGLQVVAKTPKSQSVYIDQNVSYQYEVTNTGTADLTDVTVSDDKCPGPAARQADVLGDGDAVLEPGEKWLYTCTVAASAIFTGDTTQVMNTVTVNAKDQAGKPTPPSTDTAVTNLLKPGIAIDKTGPATATAGDLLTYNLAVTNTGNTVFNDGMVVLTDALCQAPPALLSKNGDTSPETLSPGETWTYSCQVQTQAGQDKVDNTGSVTGTDQGGRNVTATDGASTALSQPAKEALPNPPATSRPGSAKLRGTVGCATASYARATISGKQIKSVTYYVNGKKVRTLTKPTSGSNYSMRLRVRSLEYGTHKVTARVVFVAGARTNAKTLRLQFSRCRPRVVQPKFTG